MVVGGSRRRQQDGTTQFRIYFQLDDNDDGRPDYLGFYSRDNATAAIRPQLVVQYQWPDPVSLRAVGGV